jgi:hypothetical protein
MSTHFIFPKPRDWNTLEDIVADTFSRKFRSYNLQRYGRQGQPQHGVDVVGFTNAKLLGIQCKHHPTGNIPISEIDIEITRAESFRPRLDELVIATSADRDVTAHNHILQLSEPRKEAGKFPVSIMFWSDIYNWLTEYPDLVYKHFVRYFPIAEIEHIKLPGISETNKGTLLWPTTLQALKDTISTTTGGITQVDPYWVSIGVTSFPAVTYANIVDLEIQLAELFESDEQSEENFLRAAEILRDVRTVLLDTSFSKNLLMHLQARLSLAFLVGWIFRSVTHFKLNLIFNEQVWTTEELPLVPTHLSEALPRILIQDSHELVLILNIGRDISSSVHQEVEKWADKPKAIVGYHLAGRVSSAAHARSIALEVSRKIKTFIDVWRIRRIHVFGVLPAALATLIGYYLNAICPISFYFLDESRTQYRLGGTISNQL